MISLVNMGDAGGRVPCSRADRVHKTLQARRNGLGKASPGARGTAEVAVSDGLACVQKTFSLSDRIAQVDTIEITQSV